MLRSAGSWAKPLNDSSSGIDCTLLVAVRLLTPLGAAGPASFLTFDAVGADDVVVFGLRQQFSFPSSNLAGLQPF